MISLEKQYELNSDHRGHGADAAIPDARRALHQAAPVDCRPAPDAVRRCRAGAAGGALLGTAKYPQALPGAEAALQSCDWTDLDEDGNSELTAEFSFSDGTLYPVNST